MNKLPLEKYCKLQIPHPERELTHFFKSKIVRNDRIKFSAEVQYFSYSISRVMRAIYILNLKQTNGKVTRLIAQVFSYQIGQSHQQFSSGLHSPGYVKI